jgi:outer membrane receptor protein involved in Fe transport
MLGGKAGKNENILQYSFYGSKSEFNNMNIKQGYEDAYNPLNYLQKQGTTVNINNKDYDPLKINNDLLKNNGIAPQSFINQYYPANYEGRVTLPEMEELPASSHMIGLNLEYRGFQLSYINMYRSTHSSIGKSTYLYKYNNPQNYWADEISRGTISYKKELFDNIRSTTNISSLSYRMDNNSSLGLTYLDNDKAYLFAASNDLLFEQLFTFVPLKNLEVITGGSYSISGNLPLTNYLKTPFDTDTYKPFSTKIKDQDTIFNGFGYNPITFNNISGFFQGYYMTNNFTFMGGLRYDQNSLYGKSTNPRFAILWKANKKTSFRASVGYAFKAPPASLAYESFAYPDRNHPDSLHYLTLPNSNLSPEQFKAYEFGVNRIFWDILQINISLYYNEIKNLIIKTNTPLKNLDIDKAFIASDSSTVITKENYSNAISKLYGIQGTMKIENLIRPIHLDIEGSVTFAKKSETLPGIEEIGDLIKNFRLMPKHFGQYKVSLIPFKNARLHLEGMWMSEWLRIILPFEKLSGDLFDDIDGFYKMDAILNYSFGRHLTAYVKVLNFFDEKYTGVNAGGLNDNLPLNPQLRRNVRIGLTYEMN